MTQLPPLTFAPAAGGAPGQGLDAAPAGESSQEPAPFAALLLLLGNPIPAVSVAPPGTGTFTAAAPTPDGDGKPLPPGGNILPALTLNLQEVIPLAVAAAAKLAADAPGTLLKGPGADLPGQLVLTQPGAMPPVSATSLPQVPAGAPSSPGPAAWAPLAPADGAFDNALGQRLAWMVNQGVQDARVRVHPEHLGPIDIRLRLEGDTAQLTLTASHSVTREALEQALPRLREQLGETGVQLTQANVGEQRNGDRRNGATPLWIEDQGLAGEAEDPVAPVRQSVPVPRLLDRFA